MGGFTIARYFEQISTKGIGAGLLRQGIGSASREATASITKEGGTSSRGRARPDEGVPEELPGSVCAPVGVERDVRDGRPAGADRPIPGGPGVVVDAHAELAVRVAPLDFDPVPLVGLIRRELNPHRAVVEGENAKRPEGEVELVGAHVATELDSAHGGVLCGHHVEHLGAVAGGGDAVADEDVLVHAGREASGVHAILRDGSLNVEVRVSAPSALAVERKLREQLEVLVERHLAGRAGVTRVRSRTSVATVCRGPRIRPGVGAAVRQEPGVVLEPCIGFESAIGGWSSGVVEASIVRPRRIAVTAGIQHSTIDTRLTIGRLGVEDDRAAVPGREPGIEFRGVAVAVAAGQEVKKERGKREAQNLRLHGNSPSIC